MEKLKSKKLKRGKLIHIRLSPKTHQRLKIRVAELNTSLQGWVSRTIRKELRPKKLLFPKPPKVEPEKPDIPVKPVSPVRDGPK